MVSKKPAPVKSPTPIYDWLAERYGFDPDNPVVRLMLPPIPCPTPILDAAVREFEERAR